MNDNQRFHTFDAPPVEPASQMNGLGTESKFLAEINEKYFVVMDGARTRYSILTNSLIRCTITKAGMNACAI
jgi:hypothetical protein